MKKKCKDFIMKIIESSLDDHYVKVQQERCKAVLSSDCFSSLNNHPKAGQVNDFVAQLMQHISHVIYDENKDRILSLINVNISSLVDDLLTEPESVELYTFISTEVGQKVFRNLDLVRDCVLKGRNILAAAIIMAWSSPSVAETIQTYIDSLEKE